MRGQFYDVFPLKRSDIKKDVYVKLRRGNATRRILCIDGDEVVLRGTRSDGVFEAVDLDTFVDEWLLMKLSDEQPVYEDGPAEKRGPGRPRRFR